MFITELSSDDVLNERLQVFQENRWILPTYFYHFITWVTERFDYVVEYIREAYPNLRKKHKFEMGRYAEMYATMMITAYIMVQYARECKFWKEEDGIGFSVRTESILLMELRIMENRIKRRDKGVLVVGAITEAVRNHRIVPVTLNAESCGRRESFYEDGEFYYFHAKELRIVVNSYCGTYYEGSEIINEDELIGALEKQQVLEIIEQGGKRQRSRKLPMQRGNTQRYLYINKKALCNFDE